MKYILIALMLVTTNLYANDYLVRERERQQESNRRYEAEKEQNRKEIEAYNLRRDMEVREQQREYRRRQYGY